MAVSEASQDVFPWLKSLPLAPEFRPSPAEFQDPIAYIFKIEKEASKYGICKILPPVPPASKKTMISNLNRSLAARAAAAAREGGACDYDRPTFTTRQQQIGFCARKQRPAQRPVWQSGEHYTFQEFEAKAKNFEKNYLKKCGKKGPLSALEIETLYWRATVDKPFSVEYANDMPGSAFIPLSTAAVRRRESGDGGTVGETTWNMRAVSRAEGSLLKFMKEEIPGVTSPMVYIAMMFSWFAWHVEDHDLHSLNYLHMGAGKTWYGVPKDAAVAFEEVVRVHGYGGELNPLVTFATLGEKTTVMSPEVFVKAGIPCCRLVQNPGEFVVTFPRAYHSGFSHGFNCGEASNIATPEWLTMAKDAAIRRAAINYPPMVSHFQLLYDFALALCSRVPASLTTKPRSSRLKDKKKSEGERLTKELFVQNVIKNNKLLHSLGRGSLVVLLPRSSSDISVCSDLRVGSQLRTNQEKTLQVFRDDVKPEELGSSYGMIGFNNDTKLDKGTVSVKEKFTSLCERNRNFPSWGNNTQGTLIDARRERGDRAEGLSDQRLFSCVTCGILSFDCVAIVQPREAAARYLMSADCSFFNDWTVGSGLASSGQDTSSPVMKPVAQGTGKRDVNYLYDVPVQTGDCQMKTGNQRNGTASKTNEEKDSGALGLLASTYGDSDSEEDNDDPDVPLSEGETNITNCSPPKKYLQDCVSQKMDCNEEAGLRQSDLNFRTDQTCDGTDEFRAQRLACRRSNGVEVHATSSCSTVSCTTEQKRLGLGEGTTSLLDMDLPFVPRSNEDSSRLHVFCLEHAAEVEQQLRPIGGVRIMLICHPEYPTIEAEAKLVAEELEIDHQWNDVEFRSVTREDEGRIQSALDNEEAKAGNSDWAVKLGINLFYSAVLSRSPLYSKQMPYNSVIYSAFGRSSPASSPSKPEFPGRRSSRQKKFVVGKWCGKVWMSHQVHPFLVQQDSEDEELDRNFHSRAVMDEGVTERKPFSILRNVTTMVARKYCRKRKMRAKPMSRKKLTSFRTECGVSDDTSEDHPYKQQWRASGNEEDSYFETGNTVSGDLSDQMSDQRLGRRGTKFQDEEDERSDDMSEDKYPNLKRKGILRHKGVHEFESEDEVSDRSLAEEYTARDFAPSDNSMENGFQPNKQSRLLEMDREASDDDSADDDDDNIYRQQREIPRSKRTRIFKNVFSYDSEENGSYRHRSRMPRRTRKASRIGRKEEFSYESAEDNTDDENRRVMKHRKVKNIEEKEDERCSDSVEEQDFCSRRKRTATRKAKPEILQSLKGTKGQPASRKKKKKQEGIRVLNVKQEKDNVPLDSYTEGPSTRLRVRNQKPSRVSETKSKKPGKKERNASSFSRVANEEDDDDAEEEEEDDEEEGSSVYRCNMEGCTMSFSTKQQLALHKRNICPVKGCGKKFFSHKYLVQHKRVHLDDRPLKCPWKGCKMTFKWAWARTEHIRVHTGERPYVCAEPGCGQTFRFVSDFSRHKRKTGHSVKKTKR
ncbi:PREDICTED: lysine-specific demethylase REF6 [Tarenaya hassleriana]|uniref:lysine-specific demethylase REF6 n=1 Tax=Tarenaya hassleriana TaxID=28532 RepID=UPI00053C675C|nr:PREDICTED: lysine-specific demethylase REF6 [Tarenaya hassleriana]